MEPSSATSHKGAITTYQPNGKPLVTQSAIDSGGVVTVTNKTGEGRCMPTNTATAWYGLATAKAMGECFNLGHD
ncbi:hypothetical protein OAF45_01320 [Candidatus Latescibacteria bacterium]|nr:hypothetical protein [Candidatus Latescibacterota bacterium]